MEISTIIVDFSISPLVFSIQASLHFEALLFGNLMHTHLEYELALSKKCPSWSLVISLSWSLLCWSWYNHSSFLMIDVYMAHLVLFFSFLSSCLILFYSYPFESVSLVYKVNVSYKQQRVKTLFLANLTISAF